MVVRFSIDGGSVRRRFKLLAVDLALIATATVSAFLLRTNFEISLSAFSPIIPSMLAALVVALVVVPWLGLNRSVWRFTTMSDCLRLLGASLAIVGGSATAISVTGTGQVSLSFGILQALLVAAYLVGARALMRVRHARRRRPAPVQFGQAASPDGEIVLVVGVNRLADLYLRSVAELAAAHVRVVGLLGRAARHTGRLVHRRRVLGALHQITDVLQDLSKRGVYVNRVVLTMPIEQLTKEEQSALRRAESCFPICVLVVPERLGLIAPADARRGAAKSNPAATFTIPAPELANLRRRSYWRAKRGVDVIGALILSIMLAPAFVLAAVLVALDVGWPLTFWQERPGLAGVGFRLYKFRTMPFARMCAPPVSRLGRFLRHTRLDELPQLINIVKGDMSFIGPRPLLATEQTAAVAARLLVRPGLTGWAQVAAGRDASVANKAALDLWYVRHACPSLDLLILVRTARMLVWGERIDVSALRVAWRDLRRAGICSKRRPVTTRAPRAHRTADLRSGHGLA